MLTSFVPVFVRMSVSTVDPTVCRLRKVITILLESPTFKDASVKALSRSVFSGGCHAI